MCRRHHRIKTHGAWTYRTIEPGTYLWTSKHGYQYLRDTTGTIDVSSRPTPATRLATPPHTPPTGGATAMPGPASQPAGPQSRLAGWSSASISPPRTAWRSCDWVSASTELWMYQVNPGVVPKGT